MKIQYRYSYIITKPNIKVYCQIPYELNLKLKIYQRMCYIIDQKKKNVFKEATIYVILNQQGHYCGQMLSHQFYTYDIFIFIQKSPKFTEYMRYKTTHDT